MRIYIKFCLFLGLLLSLTLQSCQTTEEIWINKDGTAKQSTIMDLSALLPLMMMGNSEQDADSDDPMDAMMDNLLTRPKVDTTFALKDMMYKMAAEESGNSEAYLRSLSDEEFVEYVMTLDTLSNEIASGEEDVEAMVAMMMDASINIKTDQSQGLAEMTFIRMFDDWSELDGKGNIFSNMNNMMPEQSDDMGEGTADMLNQMTNMNPSFEISPKQMIIRREALDFTPETTDDDDGQGAGFNEMEMMTSMMGDMQTRYIVHCPGKIKQVTGVLAQIDRKTATFSLPALNMSGPNEAVEVVIEYKKR